ncbi:MAG: hypothetical protein K2W85_11460 [Phycisphaerales bacterium]|nr:hypothetical protein [Phycisphaerales bacterium]
MPHAFPPPAQAEASIDIDTLLPIVVGAHPRAELSDRPIAMVLRDEIARRIAARFPGKKAHAPLQPLVLTDVWYLNDQSLRTCPCVCIGSPGVNALSAYLGDKLPSAYVVDETLMIQLDLELTELTACCWGVSPAATGAAIRAFCDKYLDAFLDAALREQEG